MNPSAATAAHPGPPRSAWRPALSGADGERALTWALRLADELRWIDGAGISPWLGDGAAGLAVLFATLSVTVGGPRFTDPTDRYLALAADRLTFDAGRDMAGLFGGVSGIPWAECVVSRLRGDGAPGSEDLDELILDLLAAPSTRPWGLSAGLVGVGVYAMERARTDPRLLELVLARLGDARSPVHGWVVVDGARRSAACPTGVRLPAGPGRHVELGMAEGLAGIVAFTALAAASPGAPPLLSEATGALLAHQAGDGAPPAFTGLPTLRSGAGRPLPTWCGGEPGVAAALTVARPLLSHPQVPQALTAALGAIPLRGGSTLPDLGLCHGVAGVAHVLHRVAMTHQRDQAWTAAAVWGRALLDRLDAGEKPAGPGFLTGSAGVALVLLALATDVTPVWDRALLLS